MGHEVIVSPVIEIVPLRPDWPMLRPEALIATSAHAFLVPLPQDWRLLPLFAVGEHTARAAHPNGPVHIGGGDWHSLLHLIRAAPFRRFAYLAGHERKCEFEAAFDPACLHIIETYDARAVPSLSPAAEHALTQGQIDVVLHYSRRSCEIFLRLTAHLSQPQPPIRHLCLSNDVAKPLILHGLKAEVAASPHEKALLALL
eukprot:gene9475-9555_t